MIDQIKEWRNHRRFEDTFGNGVAIYVDWLLEQLSEAQAENKELAANMTRCLAELSFEASAKCKALDKLHRIQLGFSTDNIADNIQLQLNAAKTDITVLQMQLKEMAANEIWLREENKVLREEAQGNNLLLIREGQEHRRCIDELKRVAEFAQCMGSPIEYEDDTIYLKSIKRYVKFLEVELNQLQAKLSRYEESEKLWIAQNEDNYDDNRRLEAANLDQFKRILKLEKKLSRYENGVEVEGSVKSDYTYDDCGKIILGYLSATVPPKFIGQRVICNVRLKEEV